MSFSTKSIGVGLILGLIVGVVIGYAVSQKGAGTTDLEQQISQLQSQISSLQS